MACKMKPRTYMCTVNANDFETADPPAGGGLFNPVSDLLPSRDFDRIRATVVLVGSTPNVEIELAGSGTDDGITYDTPTGFGAIMNDGDTVLYGAEFGIPEAKRFIQVGFLARRKNGSSSSSKREAATIRLLLEFKSGAAPAAPGGGS